MKNKLLVKELILPSFWLFVFVASSKDNAANTSMKKGNDKENYIEARESEKLPYLEALYKYRSEQFVKTFIFSRL